MYAALNADNPDMLRELIDYGDVIAVRSGIRVEVDETIGKRSKVRLLEGELAGRVGWVQTDYVIEKK